MQETKELTSEEVMTLIRADIKKIKNAKKKGFPSGKDLDEKEYLRNVGEVRTFIKEHMLDLDIIDTHVHRSAILAFKPKELGRKPSAKEAREYADKVEVYDKMVELLKELQSEKREFESRITATQIEWVKSHTGFHNSVPTKFQDKIWNLAWDYGHSHGMGEVAIHLERFIDIFD